MARWMIAAARPEHIPPIALDMREADRREVWASHRHRPGQALKAALSRSDLAWTCFVDAEGFAQSGHGEAGGAEPSRLAAGRPAFMWGVAGGSLLSLYGAPWLLGTPAILKVQREFLRQCPAYVERMQAAFPVLENWIHAENHVSIRWLTWCGFTVEKEMPEMINGELFFRFWRVANV